jgi:hypothetical protein
MCVEIGTKSYNTFCGSNVKVLLDARVEWNMICILLVELTFVEH